MQFTDERLRAMMRGRREVRVVPFPGMWDQDGANIGIRILTDDEIDQAFMDATVYVRAKATSLRLTAPQLLETNAEILDRENHRQLVFRAFVQAEPDIETGEHKRFFPSSLAVQQLDSELVQTLYAMYLDHQNYVNPSRGMTPEDVATVAEHLGKEPGAGVLLMAYDAPTLRSLVHILASQLRTLLAGK
jgi:hypothetical protein